MKNLSCKKLLALVLAVVMILSVLPFGAFAAEGENLALGKTVTVSSYEAGTTFVGGNITDGDRSTRWGTGQNAGAGEWAEIDLGEATAIKQIDIYFERSDADQNILSYQVEFYADGAYTTVYTKSEKAAQHEQIVLDEAQQAQKVKITVLDCDGGTLSWVNVGINEVELYGETYEEELPVSDNIALGRPATASNVEGGTSFTADKAVDGDTTTASRWATDMNVTNPWIEIDLDDGSVLKQINIIFERSDANQNILAYYVEAYVDGAYTTIYTHAEADGRCKQREKIILDTPVTADKMKLTITSYDGGQNPEWPSVSVLEIEAYSAEIFSLDDVTQSLTNMAGTVVDGDTLTLPAVPDGVTVEMNGADLEQIIGKDLSVYKPLTDKVVNVSFKVSDGTDSAVTGDIAVTVKGQYTQDPAKNAKPVVIPEIQEWYSESTGKLAVASVTKVTYDNAALKTVVDEFVADYETFTGIKLTAVQGAAEAGAFNFSLTAPDAKLGDEGYTMEIAADRINAASGTVTGNMYAMQTILQMYRVDNEGYAIGKMRDYPRFQVRGLLLDMARKPIAMTMISEISRTMRFYKMNDLQLHLSDNLIFLEDYGVGDTEELALNAYEAFRLESSLTNAAGEDPTAEDYFITKADMAAFIQGQRALGMNIVPEIDVPAHSLSFTKVWPEIRVVGGASGSRPLIDHFDLTKPEAVDKIKEIFDDYTKGSFITFDEDTIIHIGADEFTYNATSYRNYFNEIIPYIKETNTVRVWGSLTIINDNQTAIVPEAIEGVQMNVWNTGWADPQNMYDLGYDVINTIDGSSYMVPSGSYGRGGYGDLLNLNYLFSSFSANQMGSANLPSGDDQVLGAVYAIWNDNIDTRACGLTESDMFFRFFDALPIFAEKTWAATGQEKGSAAALTELAADIGVAPGVNPYFQVESTGDTHASYNFDSLTDGSGNGRDLTAGTAAVENGVLTLGGGSSYITTPIAKIGNGNALSFDITLTEAAQPGDILFETTPEYATHDIRIMADGTLGFTRELYDYSFGYTLPVGETVHIEITAEQQVTTLYVNGEAVGTATGKFVHNGTEKKTGITNSTFAIPLERIGSATNAISATIDNVRIYQLADPADDSRDIPISVLTPSAGDWQTGYEDTEGPAELVLDGDNSTIWHTNWYGTSRENHWIQFELSEDYVVDGLRYLPRQSGANGTILEYQIQVSNDGVNFETVTSGTWGNNTSWKVASFEGVQAKYVRLVAVNTAGDNNYVFASAAEIRLTGTKAAAHVPGEAVRENEVAPTCTEDGSYDSVVYCADCGEELSRETVTVPATGHSYENGVCTGCGHVESVAQNTATGETYGTVEEALAAAEAGQTVILLVDCAADTVMVIPGVTLDLNGHDLTAAYAVGFNTAHVIDSVGTGRLVAGMANVVLDDANAMIPVYDGEGYIFTKAGFAVRQDKTCTEGFKIDAMAYPVNMEVVELLKGGAADNNIQIVILLSWDAGDATGYQDFTFTDEVVASVYTSNKGTWNSYGKMFSMVIDGFENIENLKAQVVVVSGTNAEYVSSQTLSIT